MSVLLLDRRMLRPGTPIGSELDRACGAKRIDPVARVEATTDVSDVASVWQEFESGGTATPYQSVSWFVAWLCTAASARRETPVLVIAYDEEGTPTLLLPLVVSTRLGLTIARFAGAKHANVNMPLLGAGVAFDRADVHRLFTAVACLRPEIDLFVLEAMPVAWEGVTNPLIGYGTRQYTAQAMLVTLPSHTMRHGNKACSTRQAAASRSSPPWLGGIPVGENRN